MEDPGRSSQGQGTFLGSSTKKKRLLLLNQLKCFIAGSPPAEGYVPGRLLPLATVLT